MRERANDNAPSKNRLTQESLPKLYTPLHKPEILVVRRPLDPEPGTDATLTLVTSQLRTLSGRDALLEASGGDPYVRWEADDALLGEAWALGSAVGFRRRSHMRKATQLNVIGPEHDIDGLLSALKNDGFPDDITGISIDQPMLAMAERHFDLDGGGDWDWMWTTTSPSLPTDIKVTTLDDAADAAELVALNAIASPTAESQPGAGLSHLWLGVRDDAGRIVAAGAMQRTGAGMPHLVGIVTHPDARGRGYGEAVTAALTASALDSAEVCTLGMYSANDVARRIYQRLGYTSAHAWASRRFARPN